jgi:hypothetical protein
MTEATPSPGPDVRGIRETEPSGSPVVKSRPSTVPCAELRATVRSDHDGFFAMTHALS